MTNDTDEAIWEYIKNHSSPQSPLLDDLVRQTHLKTVRPHMMSGPVQGRLLSFLSKMTSPRRILEIGTFTGFATLCLAEGLAPGGEIITLEADPERETLARHFFEKSPYSEAITLLIGDAKDLLPGLGGSFDLVFMDAKKMDYPIYYEMVLDKMSPGGLLVCDNILWYGQVTQANRLDDPRTRSLHGFNQMVLDDPRVENFILPLRDGLNLVRKVAQP